MSDLHLHFQSPMTDEWTALHPKYLTGILPETNKKSSISFTASNYTMIIQHENNLDHWSRKKNNDKKE